MRYVNKRNKTKYSFPENNWYRHEAYGIVDGCIRPSRGAAISEYNPWEQYSEIAGWRRTVATPYGSFLELGRQLEPYLATGILSPIPLRLERWIAHWCSKWGYAGVLASMAMQIILEPAIVSSKTDGPFRQTQTRYYRFGGGWGEETMRWDWVEQKRMKPTVTFWYWHLRRWQEKDISEIARFFPSVSDPVGYQYPSPSSLEFRQLYAEPLADFARVCVRFSQAAEVVSNHLRGISPLIGNMSGDSSFILTESMALLGSLEHGIGPWQHELVEGELSVRNESVSLLSSFARMVFLDLARGRRIIRCARCERIFVSDDPRALYCSAKCRRSLASSRYRATHKSRPRKTVQKLLRPTRRRARVTEPRIAPG